MAMSDWGLYAGLEDARSPPPLGGRPSTFTQTTMAASRVVAWAQRSDISAAARHSADSILQKFHPGLALATAHPSDLLPEAAAAIDAYLVQNDKMAQAAPPDVSAILSTTTSASSLLGGSGGGGGGATDMSISTDLLLHTTSSSSLVLQAAIEPAISGGSSSSILPDASPAALVSEVSILTDSQPQPARGLEALDAALEAVPSSDLPPVVVVNPRQYLQAVIPAGYKSRSPGPPMRDSVVTSPPMPMMMPGQPPALTRLDSFGVTMMQDQHVPHPHRLPSYSTPGLIVRSDSASFGMPSTNNNNNTINNAASNELGQPPFDSFHRADSGASDSGPAMFGGLSASASRVVLIGDIDATRPDSDETVVEPRPRRTGFDIHPPSRTATLGPPVETTTVPTNTTYLINDMSFMGPGSSVVVLMPGMPTMTNMAQQHYMVDPSMLPPPVSQHANTSAIDALAAAASAAASDPRPTHRAPKRAAHPPSLPSKRPRAPVRANDDDDNDNDDDDDDDHDDHHHRAAQRASAGIRGRAESIADTIEPNHQGRYACIECDRTFRSRSDLTAHLRTHTGEKPMICRTCGKTFAHSSNLRQHERSHTGEKRYQCSWPGCSKCFAHPTSRNDHEAKHRGERPYVCEVEGCHKTFTAKANLTRHRKDIHGLD